MPADTLICLICRAADVAPLDERDAIPIAQNLIFHDQREARACPTGTLRMVRCMSCGFSWNSAFNSILLTYDQSYENNQSLSGIFSRHLEDVADRIHAGSGDGDDLTIVEVGCGQGYFLEWLEKRFDGRLSNLVGFDPAFRDNSMIPELARVETCYFNSETSRRLDIRPDIIVTRHVIEHVDDPIEFLTALREVCEPGTSIFVETPTIQWILDNNAVHDLYYEHCSVFDVESLRLALEKTGFAVDRVDLMLEGQYMLASARAADGVVPSQRADKPHNAAYRDQRQAYLDGWRERLSRDAAAGERVALWGASSKGVTLATLIRNEENAPQCAIDINPARDGTYMPLSGMPVVSPARARALSITKAYVMNPAYFEEIERACRADNWEISLEAVH